MLVLLLLFATARVSNDSEFVDPRPVTITGYSGDAMEPFITRDGKYLLFNNSNEKPSETDIHWAERVDDFTFAYKGRLQGANSPALDAVPTMDRDGTLYFISMRNYERLRMTVYTGKFHDGAVFNVGSVQHLSSMKKDEIIFDVEVTADGQWLYFAEGTFNGGAVPVAADIGVAVKDERGRFHRFETQSLAAINTGALEYAPCISEDRKELFFTRVVNGEPAIFRSTRPDIESPWGAPRRLAAIKGFAQAPTIAPGGTALYYHAKRNGQFVIERVSRRSAR